MHTYLDTKSSHGVGTVDIRQTHGIAHDADSPIDHNLSGWMDGWMHGVVDKGTKGKREVRLVSYVSEKGRRRRRRRSKKKKQEEEEARRRRRSKKKDDTLPCSFSLVPAMPCRVSLTLSKHKPPPPFPWFI